MILRNSGGPPAVTGTWSEKLIIRHHGRLVLVDMSEVRWLEAARNYVRIYTRDRTYVTRAKMADLEYELDPDTFVRIHRGAIINLNCARSFRPLSNGGCLVELDGAVEVRMSRTYRAEVLSRLARAGRRRAAAGAAR
jgi:two-component system, LytTR family, response regulator